MHIPFLNPKKEKTIAQKALDLLNKIPAEDFIRTSYSDGIGKCCAIGHLERLTSKNPKDYSSSNCYDKSDSFGFKVRQASGNFISKRMGNKDVCYDLASVNNTPLIDGYNEPVIKTRVIKLLKDMVKSGY